MIKAFFVDDDADVSESVKKDQRAEFESFVARDGFELVPVIAGAGTLKAESRLLKNHPDQTGTIDAVKSGRAVAIGNAEFGIHRH